MLLPRHALLLLLLLLLWPHGNYAGRLVADGHYVLPFFHRLISKIARSIDTELCHMFYGDPYL